MHKPPFAGTREVALSVRRGDACAPIGPQPTESVHELKTSRFVCDRGEYGGESPPVADRVRAQVIEERPGVAG